MQVLARINGALAQRDVQAAVTVWWKQLGVVCVCVVAVCDDHDDCTYQRPTTISCDSVDPISSYLYQHL
jgi:hypothetical protein